MIRANFNTYASYVTDSLYQWDLNQVLSVTGLNLAVVPEVHFSNANTDRAIVRQATKVNNVISVGIPNSLLQEPLRIRAHIGIYEGDTFKVVELVEIPVIARKRPNDYQIQDSDEEIYSFQALENAIANMVKVSDFNTDKASINASISTLDKSVNSRIDNIIAHNNDTEGNTELVDIRTDVDGNTHDSAGAAVRVIEKIASKGLTAFSAIADKITVDFEPLKGFYKKADFVSNDLYSSALLSCEKGDIFYVTSIVNISENLALALFFDADMNFISYYKQNDGITQNEYKNEPVIISNANVKFVCFTSLGDISVLKAVFDGNKRINEIENKVDNIDALLEFETKTTDNLADINTNLRTFDELDLELKTGFYRVNDYMSLEIYTTAVIPCSKGDIFKVSTIVNASAYLALASFYSADMTFISYYLQNDDSGSAIVYENELVKIEDDCAYMVVTCPTESIDMLRVSKMTNDFISTVDLKSSIDNISPMTISAIMYYRDMFNLQRRDALTNTRKKLNAGNLNYTILGDSITDTWCGHAAAGGGASSAEYGYPQIVYRWLKERYGDEITFTNNGTGGNTVADAYAVIDEQITANNYDVVGIALGTNDWNKQTDLTTFYNTYKSLIDQILTDNDCEIFLIGLGYFAPWKPEKSLREEDYNRVIRELAKEYDIPYVDTYNGMYKEIVLGGYTFEEITLTADPVHPNDIGHRVWASEVFKLFEN